MKIIKYIAGFILSGILFTSCIKDDAPALGTKGSSLVKFLEAPVNTIYLTPFTDVRAIDLFSIRKNANSQQNLNTATTIKVTSMPSLIDEYNDANGTSIESLPDSLFTTDISNSGDVYDMTMAAGEFAKIFTIQLDGSKWDLSHTYAMAAVITEIDNPAGVKASSGTDTIIAIISIKNKYDGVYELKGHHNREPYNYPYDVTMNLVTSGVSSVAFFWPDAGDYGHPIGVGPDNDVSWYGNGIAPNMTFDPTTDKVTSVSSLWGAAGTPLFLYDGEGAPESKYDPATKTIYVYFYYKTSDANNFDNRGWNDTLVYKGPR